jgi:hypothetical protein
LEILDAQIADMNTQEQSLREQVVPQLHQSQLDKLTLQQELLERAFTTELSAMHAQHQQAQASLRQSHEVRESEMKRELSALHQIMDGERDIARIRIVTLQQKLVKRERTFTTELGAIHAQHQHAQAALRQSQDARESELSKEFHHCTERCLLRCALEKPRKFESRSTSLISFLRKKKTCVMRCPSEPYFSNMLATRIAAMQSTWLWRLSMLFRRVPHWRLFPDSFSPIKTMALFHQ